MHPLRRPIALLVLAGLSWATVHSQTPQPGRGVQNITAGPARTGPAPVGPYYALVIGNNDYQHLKKLQTAVGDAKEVARLLHDDYGFKTSTLYNATRDEIMTALDDYRGLPEKSNLLIYFAGHGHKEVAADRAYWLPVDAEEGHTSRWINAADIIDSIRAIPSRHVLVIADSCFSGDLSLHRDLPSLPSKPIEPGFRDADLSSALAKKSRHIMSSGGDEPVADLGAEDHSVFAGALLESLKEMKGNAFTAGNLWSDRVRPLVAGRSAQTPNYATIRDSDADLGDFVFFRSRYRNDSMVAEDVPLGWGFLVNLQNAQIYDLKAEHISIGRDVKGIANDISFPNQLVSRQHLIVNRNRSVSDLRSTNGTTINANVLAYGVGAELVDNDILVLANVQALQFRDKKPSPPLKIPEQAWAVLIDGQSKNYLYLTGAEYSLTLRNGKISLSSGLAESVALKLRRLHDKAEMFVATREWQILEIGRSKENEYEIGTLPAATWIPAQNLPLLFAKLSSDQKQILAKGPAIQIVLFGE